jgi:hypothetical protein
METAMRSLVTYMGTLALAAGALALPRPITAQDVSQTVTSGPYTVTLKVLPAESFKGVDAEMTRDGGAMPDTLDSPNPPNHHMVVFVEENGAPVKHATVTIRYKKDGGDVNAWTLLPVMRMHVAGKGAQTTHFGNNVTLQPGTYEARVEVNGSAPIDFAFSVSSG